MRMFISQELHCSQELSNSSRGGVPEPTDLVRFLGEGACACQKGMRWEGAAVILKGCYGAPCTGKSTIFNEWARCYQDARLVPELAKEKIERNEVFSQYSLFVDQLQVLVDVIAQAKREAQQLKRCVYVIQDGSIFNNIAYVVLERFGCFGFGTVEKSPLEPLFQAVARALSGLVVCTQLTHPFGFYDSRERIHTEVQQKAIVAFMRSHKTSIFHRCVSQETLHLVDCPEGQTS